MQSGTMIVGIAEELIDLCASSPFTTAKSLIFGIEQI